MIKLCIEKGLNAKVIDFYELGKLIEKFDAVFSLNSLLHVPRKDLPKVLKEIEEVLNPGGIFYFGVYGGFDSEEIITDKSKMNLPRFLSFLTKELILSAVKEYFEVVHYEEIDFGSSREGMCFQSLTLRKREQ